MGQWEELPRGPTEHRSTAGMMHRVCLCLPRQLAQLGEVVVSKCSDAVTQKIKFTQCDVDDPGIKLGENPIDAQFNAGISSNITFCDLQIWPQI